MGAVQGWWAGTGVTGLARNAGVITTPFSCRDAGLVLDADFTAASRAKQTAADSGVRWEFLDRGGFHVQTYA
jgi:hypothetical protein